MEAVECFSGKAARTRAVQRKQVRHVHSLGTVFSMWRGLERGADGRRRVVEIAMGYSLGRKNPAPECSCPDDAGAGDPDWFGIEYAITGSRFTAICCVTDEDS